MLLVFSAQQAKGGVAPNIDTYQETGDPVRLPRHSSLLGDEDKVIEIVYGEEKNILYWAD
jgi:hypothetical protein